MVKDTATGNVCAPKKYDSKNDTCFTVEQLSEMANAFNRYVTKYKLNPESGKNHKITDTSLITVKPDKSHLLKEVMSRFSKVCSGDEICLTQQAFMNEIVKEMNEDILYGTFRIAGPTKAKEWLSTVDIDGIMRQYENVYPDFKFMGAVPRNCDKVDFCSLFSADFAGDLKKGKERLGIVFNQDAFGESGSHWVALFIDIPKGQCYYCDSLGKKPVPDVVDYIDRFRAF